MTRDKTVFIDKLVITRYVPIIIFVVGRMFLHFITILEHVVY